MMKHNIVNHVFGAALFALAFVVFIVFISAICGCSSAQPASRATTAQYDIRLSFDDSARNNTVNLTLGDGALASADSSGSTETQTATPTLDIKPDVDVRYNDAAKSVSDAAATVAKDVSDAVVKAAAQGASTNAAPAAVTE